MQRRSTLMRREALICGLAVSLALAGCGDGAGSSTALAQGNGTPEPGGTPAPTVAATPSLTFDGTFVSLWTADAMRAIEQDTSNTIPLIIPDAELFAPDLFTWDGWPLRNRDGSIAELDGWVVYIALSADRVTGDDIPAFFTRSEWRYWFTRDGNWQPGGLVFAEGTPLGSRQWAGSASYDAESGRAEFYYTAVGIVPEGSEPTYPSEFPQDSPAAGRPPVIQQMAVASAQVVTDEQGVRFEDFSEHEIILEADGEIYQTFDDAITDQVIYGMRDPEYFRDPADGREYILFTANAAFKPGPFNGVVGIAERRGPTDWALLPPIIAAPEVSSQLERPHVIVRDATYYVFFSTHAFTFAEDGAGPEGLYGFATTSGDFRGQYVPLNRHGLVAGNPQSKPMQTYSYLALPSPRGALVMSYLNTAGNVDNQAGWIGSPGPLFEVAIDGLDTTIVEAQARPPGLMPESGTLAASAPPDPAAPAAGDGERMLGDALGRF